jgi:3-methylcrotonyl-CoA carboxylase alpha subunit/geranyl-CoA carboxylase alpha subunit
LQHPVFLAGEALIPFLAEQADTVRQSLHAGPDARKVAALAVLYAQQAPAAGMPSPFTRPVRMGLGLETFSLNLQELGQGRVCIQADGATHLARLDGSAEMLHIDLNGTRWQARVVVCQGTGATTAWHVQLQGPQCVELWLSEQSFNPPSSGASAQAAEALRAPFNGKLIALHVQEGVPVKLGDAVLVIESMKLEHILCAPHDAVVHSISASVGQQVAPGQVLVQWKDAA